ncbi:MAG TPA: cytochrome P450 [Acidimicrobiia bacterium]|nr:cytochrome P450 [Acidimicrobiia bacterium]
MVVSARVDDPRTFDLTDLDNYAGGFPHAVFTRARRECPVYWHPPTRHTPDGEGFWVVTRHADVLRVLRDPATFSSETGGSRPYGGTLIQDLPLAGIVLNMMDDPRHQRIRRLVSVGFTPRMIGRLERELRRRTRAILEPVVAAGECDLVVDVARELPLQAIAMLMGVPQDDRGRLCEWVDITNDLVDRTLNEVTDESRAAGASLQEYGAALIEERRRCPADDMISAVIGATLPDEEPSQLTEPELRAFFSLLFTAGSETTRKAIAGGVLALMEQPDEMARLRGDPSLVATTVDEMVRWTSPSVYKRRTATRDVVLGGETVRGGEKVTLWEMSADRDETVFAEPFRFDAGRDPNPHVGFGHGAHFCLGANLARLEIRIVLEELLDHVSVIEPAGEPVWTRSNRLFGLRNLPVRVSAT